MARPQQFFDWQEIVDDQVGDPVAGSRVRLRWILALFGLALAVIFARAGQLEWSDGQTYRRLAATPIERSVGLAASRGRILARDGTPLAEDRQATSLAVHFRTLETPSDPDWLRRLARSRLAKADRRRPERIAEMETTIRGELATLHQRLAAMCKLSDEQWRARTDRIQRRVQALAARVNERRLERFEERAAEESAATELSATAILAGLFAPPDQVAPSSVLIAEQTAYHRVVDGVPPELARQIEQQAKDFPGVKIVRYTRRNYPLGPSAAHLVGHVGSRAGLGSTIVPAGSGQHGNDPMGLMGVERQFESALRGQAGWDLQSTDHSGKVLASIQQRKPVAGRDVVLTIDGQLQLAAEQLLDRAIRRREQHEQSGGPPAGGAITVMDIRTGEVLCAASGPRFDPNLFADGSPRVEEVLHDPRQPLFDRVVKMAIPPGSVFKPLTALALLDNHVVDSSGSFHCQGYLTDPDRLRCQIFRQHGIGHGDVSLADALAQSCNVYFFHHAAELGAAPLVDWASRFGFGRPTGIDLADEAAGQLPTPDQLRQLSQTQALAIGQGAFTATPLQVVRMFAAIGNGGYLVTPLLTRERIAASAVESSAEKEPISEALRIPGLTPEALQAVHEGLRRAVDDPNGTAFHTVRMNSLAIAGKTGTAETGGEQEDHAWFAGYVPADAPRFAFVVVLEHAGSGATAAGSVAKTLVQRLEQLGYFGLPKTVEKPIPPGKG